MTMTTAMMVHALMEQPDRWKNSGDGTITNGYYMIALNGSQYGMGASKYHSTDAEAQMLLKAITMWGGDKSIPSPSSPPEQVQHKRRPQNEDFGHTALMDFAKEIRVSHKAYTAHMDPSVLSNAVNSALQKLDEAILPNRG